jgi:hypothetical protein
MAKNFLALAELSSDPEQTREAREQLQKMEQTVAANESMWRNLHEQGVRELYLGEVP